ncbi:PAS domain-containing sensor histidine kinase [Acidicapsa acidisoli]|uniref:PAS domain-containing sensor histidine kinase n=1 Tax=Acidicapsa acidisoli TaxID=1615681 RepID=UPI0021DF6201|nr:ATP-binding protein [Acidicapsa acidisoli]
MVSKSGTNTGTNSSADFPFHESAKSERRAHELFRKIADGVPICICIMASDGGMVYANKVASTVLGKPTEQILGNQWMQHIHPEQYEEAHENWMCCVATRTPLDTRWMMLQSDGLYRWQHILAVPSFNEEGQLANWCLVIVDIDEQVRTEVHLREMRAKLNNASRIATVVALSASIAHELNRPLTNVVTSAQDGKRWLAADPSKTGEAAASLEEMLRDGRAVNENMQHICALFKQETFDKKEASVSEMIKEAIRMIQQVPRWRDISIEYSFERDLAKIFVDPIQIQEVLINLFSNALEAMEITSASPRLQICVAIVSDKEVLVQVIVNGPGVDDLENIFKTLVTTEEKGIGVGLAISRSMVETQEGQLWAENNPKGGTRFNLRFPISRISTAAPSSRWR